MIAGGEKTQIPPASLSQSPTTVSASCHLLAITGNLRDDSNPVPELCGERLSDFPGHVVKELLPATPGNQKLQLIERVHRLDDFRRRVCRQTGRSEIEELARRTGANWHQPLSPFFPLAPDSGLPARSRPAHLT